MRKLSKGEWVAVVLAIAFVAFIFFGGEIMKLFNFNQMANTNEPIQTQSFNNGGVTVTDNVVGQGTEVKGDEILTLHYILALQDGTVIQNSKDSGTPFQFALGKGQVIKGFELGLQGMKVGGTRTIVIPPELGYGAQQVGPIPANSTLVFKIELIEAKNSQ